MKLTCLFLEVGLRGEFLGHGGFSSEDGRHNSLNTPAAMSSRLEVVCYLKLARRRRCRGERASLHRELRQARAHRSGWRKRPLRPGSVRARARPRQPAPPQSGPGLVLPMVAELATTTGHTSALAVWGNRGPTIVHIEQGAQPVRARGHAAGDSHVGGGDRHRPGLRRVPAAQAGRALHQGGAARRQQRRRRPPSHVEADRGYPRRGPATRLRSRGGIADSERQCLLRAGVRSHEYRSCWR